MYYLKKFIGKKPKEFLMNCSSLKIIFKILKRKQLNFRKLKLKYQKDHKKFASI